jgi:hypothetical protein
MSDSANPGPPLGINLEASERAMRQSSGLDLTEAKEAVVWCEWFGG